MDLSQQKQIHGYVSLPKCNLLLPAIESLHVEHVVQSLWTLGASNPGPGDRKHMNQAMCGESQRQPHNYLETNSHKQLYIYIYILYICIPTPLEANKETTPGTIWYNYYVVGKLLVALGSSLTTQEISIHSDPIGLGYE